MFTASLRRARIVPNIDGDGFVQLGLHTSDLTKEEMSNLLDLMDAFAAERGVTFKEYQDSDSSDPLKHATVEQMIEWTGQPSLLPGAINFGKHRGTPWSQVDPSYLDWIVAKSDLDTDTKFTAKHWLSRRRADNR